MPSAADLEAAEQAELAAQYADSLRAAEPATGGDDPDDGRPSKSGRRHKSRAWVEKLHAEARACLEEEPPSAEQALVLLQKAVFLSPQDGVTYALRAEAYVYACDFCSAVLNLKRSVACAGGVGRAAGGGDGGGSRTYQLVKARKRLSEVVDAQALALLQAGVVEEAEELFALACEAERMSPAPLLHRALAQFMLGRYSEALRSLSTAAALAPTDARVFLLRAKVHWETKNFGHAALAATEGLKVGRLPELVALAAGLRQQSDVSFKQGTGHMLKREWSQALSCLAVACSLDPASGRKLIRKGIARRFCDDAEGAISDLRQALHLIQEGGGESADSDDATTAKKQLGITLNHVGTKCFEEGDYGKAHEQFTLALAMDRNHAYLVNRGDCLREQGQLAQCITDYMEALESTDERLDAANKEVCIRLAVALNEVGMQLFQRNQYVQAFDYFCQCVHQLPDVLEYRLNRFHAAEACGQLHTAADDLRAALRMDPNHSYVRSRLMEFQ